MIALLDNTVLSNFALVGQGELLRCALGADAATTEAVWAELQTGILRGRVPPQDWAWLPLIALTDDERESYEGLRQRLDSGEASCLALAMSRGCRVFTDDRDARALAARLGIPVSGTIGLLVRLVDLGALTVAEGDRLLAQMVAYGYHSPTDSLEHML